MLVDSMVKDIDGYLLNKYNNRKLVVKVRTFSSAKTIDMKRLHQIHKRDFNPDLYILQIGTKEQVK